MYEALKNNGKIIKVSEIISSKKEFNKLFDSIHKDFEFFTGFSMLDRFQFKKNPWTGKG